MRRILQLQADPTKPTIEQNLKISKTRYPEVNTDYTQSISYLSISMGTDTRTINNLAMQGCVITTTDY